MKFLNVYLLILVVFVLSSCKKTEDYSIKEHPEYQNFLNLFEDTQLPITLQWKSLTTKFEWSKNKPIEQNLLNIFVDSLSEKTEIQYFAKYKLLIKENFAVILMGNSATQHDMPGWVVLSIRKDGEILGKEFFRFAKNSIGDAKLTINPNGDMVFEKTLKVFEKGAVRTIKSVYKYKIDDEGNIKEKDEDTSESLTVIPKSFLNNFPQGNTPFYINSDFLNSIKNYRFNEFQELLHENWYRPIDLDSALKYFPKLEKTIGDRIQVACGAFKLIYKHENFSVGVVVTRQAGNQLRAGVTAFHLFTFDRKTQKTIDFLPMAAYIVEIWNEEKQKNEYSLGSFQFFDDLKFVLRNLKGIQESSKDTKRNGYIKDDGTFFLMN